ncbi:hypothetical protein LF599_13725 [Pseudodesulfovibrio thermohalotolerans]|uniref:hypothetical protein n=1 Tax=Pseudodesulfovibrio thermohalotolerans TaxID=2880651 RepID=UPI0022BA075B|nr:hypothetical protein [Pseudodesulfovibrio thermohalotolerans]WFS61725.1 hypothetical protein LF599_13725 [Pseudodesulfovibrio thermohalotolerans]
MDGALYNALVAATAAVVIAMIFLAIKFVLSGTGRLVKTVATGGAPDFYGDYKYHSRVRNLKSSDFRKEMAELNQGYLEEKVGKEEYDETVARLLQKYE